ncbi:Hsp20/alpha crystallin family protein [Stetteria hydrogenophila]
MSEDPLDVLSRLLRNARVMERRLTEIIEDYWGFTGKLLEEVETALREGVIEPLFRVEDLGDWIAVVVDLAGAGDQVDVRVYRDRVEVEASLRREAVEEAVTHVAWRGAIKRYKATITLPHPVDPSTARYERRRGLLVIYARKERA